MVANVICRPRRRCGRSRRTPRHPARSSGRSERIRRAESSLTRLAMTVAGVMIAHQVAGKAVRDAMFLERVAGHGAAADGDHDRRRRSSSPSRSTRGCSPASGRAWSCRSASSISAIGHVVEWHLRFDPDPWIAVVVYLHVAGFGALLLSGFWSLMSELFDPQTARGELRAHRGRGHGRRICSAASATAQLARAAADTTPLLMLAALHARVRRRAVASSGRVSPIAPPAGAGSEATGRVLPFDVLRSAPHIRTLALMVVLGTAGAAIVDYLLKSAAAAEAARADGSRPAPSCSSSSQSSTPHCSWSRSSRRPPSAPAVRRLGLGRTIADRCRPASASALAGAAVPAFPMFALARGDRVGAARLVLPQRRTSCCSCRWTPTRSAARRRFSTSPATGPATPSARASCSSCCSPSVEFLATSCWRSPSRWPRPACISRGGSTRCTSACVERRLVEHGEHTPIVVGSERAGP